MNFKDNKTTLVSASSWLSFPCAQQNCILITMPIAALIGTLRCILSFTVASIPSIVPVATQLLANNNGILRKIIN